MHVNSIRHLSVNICKAKKVKDPKSLPGFTGLVSKSIDGSYISLSSGIKEAAKLGSSLGFVTQLVHLEKRIPL